MRITAFVLHTVTWKHLRITIVNCRNLHWVNFFFYKCVSNCFSQLREEFDQGWEVQMDEENGVHDVAALLKEFFRDLPDPLLTRDLYTAFLNTTR